MRPDIRSAIIILARVATFYMPRSIWNGTISFGMVSIPVKLYPATSDKDIALNELHTVCHTQMKRKRWCPHCDREVEADEVVKGYQYSKGQFVELTDEDFEKIPLPSKHTIDVAAFVEGEEIDPIYFDASYNIEPDEAGAKAFSLFMYALHERKMTAVAKVTLRKKEQLCALRPYGNLLILETLYYSDEVRVSQKEAPKESKLTDGEQKMALALVDLLKDEFKPQEYTDAYREALVELIEAKMQGKEVVQAPEAPARVVDLMDALRASLEQAKKQRGDKKREAG